MLSTRRSKLHLAATTTLLVTASLAFAEPWVPCKFDRPARYEYRITQYEAGKPTPLDLTLDIEASGEKNTKGEPLFWVTHATRELKRMEDVDAGTVFGVNQILAIAPRMMYGNQMFAAMLEQLDLEIGKKLDFHGAGYANVVRKETVAGVEGYLVEVFEIRGDQEQKAADLVVHPHMPFPLRSKMYVEGDLVFEMELLRYTEH